MKPVQTDKAPKAIGPYAQANVIWNTLYSSGQIPLDPTTMTLVEWGIEQQAKQVCENLWEVLIAGWFNYSDVIKTTIYLDNLDNFNIINEIYWEYFSHKPSRSTVEVSKLPMGALVEIDVIAIKNEI
jgi:2-iminobutanoate/2-iminopropanoate deaminase